VKRIIFKYQYLLTVFAIVLIYCSCEEPLNVPEHKSMIVVDGWIENDGFAHVLLTRTTPFFASIDSASYLDLVETFASVSVSNSKETEFLTLTSDKSLFPWHVYKTTSMKGEVGETYHLRVKFYDTILTATTIISESPAIDSVWFDPLSDDDTVGALKMLFTDNLNEDNYYRILAKTDKDARFYPIMASAFNDKNFVKATNEWPILKGKLTQVDNIEDLYFRKGENVTIKLCSIDRPAFDFWNNYQIETLNAANPFASTGITLSGNINGEGLGIWSGAGVDIYRIGIK